MALAWSHSGIANSQRAERVTALAAIYTPPVRIALIGCSLSSSKASFLHPRLDCRASADSASVTAPVIKAEESEDAVPKPIVLIDQDSDPDATVVKLSFGDRLGALLDTMKALKDLGLNVVKGTVTPSASSEPHQFVITRADTGRKVEDPELLEAIRLTIINNLLHFQESSEQLALGEAFGIRPPPNKPDINFSTHITVQKDGPKRSLLTIETADRPGLLLEIIKVLTDISVTVESGEIDTEGLIAKDKFHVSYRGAALSKSLEEVLRNALRYFLRRPQTDEDSY